MAASRSAKVVGSVGVLTVESANGSGLSALRAPSVGPGVWAWMPTVTGISASSEPVAGERRERREGRRGHWKS